MAGCKGHDGGSLLESESERLSSFIGPCISASLVVWVSRLGGPCCSYCSWNLGPLPVCGSERKEEKAEDPKTVPGGRGGSPAILSL